MSSKVTTIPLKRMFAVNCYLVETAGSFVLVDTGMASLRTSLAAELEAAGCRPGNLRLIVLTHAHSDHAGNCAYLRETFESPIAMHAGDADKVERGDMFFSAEGAKRPTVVLARFVSSLVGVARFDPFVPDVLLEDGEDLSKYGLDAKALHFPGHSPGSLGILTAEGDLFCGDLLTNSGQPERNSIIDDTETYGASVARLATLPIRTVYPGHGDSFPMEAFA